MVVEPITKSAMTYVLGDSFGDTPHKLTDVTPFIGPGLMRVGGHGHAAAPC